jgi:hypothetical protein
LRPFVSYCSVCSHIASSVILVERVIHLYRCAYYILSSSFVTWCSLHKSLHVPCDKYSCVSYTYALLILRVHIPYQIVEPVYFYEVLEYSVL